MGHKKIFFYARVLFLFVFSNALAKTLPLYLGVLISNSLGAQAYTYFVSFILLSNLLLSCSALGCTPQILANNKDKYTNSEIIHVGLLFLVFLYILIYIFHKLSIIDSDILNLPNGMLSLMLYSFGMFCMYVSSSVKNSYHKHNQASIIWVMFSLFGIFFGAIFYVCKLDSISSFLLMYSSGAFIIGVIFASKNSESYIRKPFKFSAGGYKSIAHNVVTYSLFGFCVTSIFYLYQNGFMVSDSENAPYMSLLLQIFAIALYVPSILGGIVIPNIKRIAQNSNNGNVIKFYVVYFFISLIVSLFIYGFFPIILKAYNMEGNSIFKLSLLCILIASILAAIHSFSIQRLVANNNYNLLIKITLLWFCVCMLGYLLTDKSLVSLSASLVVAYFLVNVSAVHLLNNKLKQGMADA